MNDTATADHAEPLTLENVYRELQALRERVERRPCSLDRPQARGIILQPSVRRTIMLQEQG